MDSFSEFSLDFARWLQANYPQLESSSSLLDEIGGFELYLIVIILIYWCLNKRLGATLAYLMTFSITVNSLLKHTLRDPRPYWTVKDISLGEESSYGIPSGHAQNATVFYGTFALWFRKSWIWLLSIFLILIMALSRIFLGVHDIEDVLGGFIVGVLILMAYYFWDRFGESWFMNRILGQRLLIAISLPLILTVIYGIILLLTEPAGEESSWFQLIDLAEITSYENFALSIAALFGMSIGLVMEQSRVRFLVEGPFWKRLLRFAVGLVPILALWFGLGRYIPEEPAALKISLNALSFLLINLWIAYYGPLVFTRLNLADRARQPASLILP